tara:strand:- start:661 stop:933 length:273 start_codon:yes stop_codon:yes gene_type:complete
MKPYLQGLITGAVLAFSIVVLMGQSAFKIKDASSKALLHIKKNNVQINSDVGTYQFAEFANNKIHLLDTRSGYMFSWNTNTNSWKAITKK